MRTLLVSAVVALLLVGCTDRPNSGTSSEAQPDTLRFKQELAALVDHLRVGEIAEAEALAQAIFEGSHDDPALYKPQITALSMLGQILQRRSQPDSALAYYREGLRVAEQAKDTISIGNMWLNIGTVMDGKGLYRDALHAQLTALRWKEYLNDSAHLGSVLHNLSVLYWRQDSIEPAIKMLQRSIAIKRVSDSLRLASGLNGLGVLLIEAKRPDSAISVLKESLALEDRIGGGANRDLQLTNLGLAFDRAGKLDSAVHYYEVGLIAAKAQGHQEYELRALYGKGDIWRKRGRYELARADLDSSLAIATRIGSLEDMKEAHLSLEVLYEVMGDYKAALHHYNAYHALSDSLMNAGTETGMEELRLRYDTEKKDRENNELRTTQELAELRAERNRWVAIGIGVLAIAIAVSAWAMVQRNRQRAREREAELEQQAMRLQMDPHFLFNALNAIPGMYADGDRVAANDHVADLSRFLRLVLETSRRRTIPLSQEVELVERYLRISANRRPGHFTWAVKVMPHVQAERVAIPPMLIQPIVENAIEHGMNGARDGHVSVLVDQAGGILHIEVKDNGVGPGVAAQRTARRNNVSMGIDLVRDRIAIFDRQTSAMEAVEVREGKAPDGTTRGTVVSVRLRTQQMSEHAAVGDRG